MLLIKWEKLPDFMKTEEVKVYYLMIKKRTISLISKRCFDIIVSLVLLIVLSPVLLFVSLWIKLDSRGPVLFKQERVTQYGKQFKIYKFRTMVVDADKVGSLVTVKNDNRITKVGKKIRKCRLDEIPQLLNVLKGEMTFVGARPEVKKYVDKYSDEMLATLLLPAGITSLASINYRDEDDVISDYTGKGMSIDEIYINKILPEKMKYNLNYLKEFDLIKDLILCVKTVI